MSANNPASRLFGIIEAGKNESRDRSIVAAWTSILDVPEEDRSLLFTRVAHVMALPKAIQKEIEQIDNINHELHLKWIPSVEAAFSVLNFDAPWSVVIDKFNGEVDYGVQICGDVLNRNRPEKIADAEMLSDLLEQIRGLIADFEQSEIPTNLRVFVYEHLCTVRNAIEEYRIRGIKPIEAEVERLVGALSRDPSLWLRTRESNFGRRFWKAMANLAMVTTIVVGQIQIGHEIFDALSGAKKDDDKQIEITIDNDVNINTGANGIGIVPDHNALPSVTTTAVGPNLHI